MGIKSVLFPAIFIFLGYLLQGHVIPQLQRSYQLLGLWRTDSHYPSRGSCVAVHQDKFLGCEDMHLFKKEKGTTYVFAACLGEYSNRPRVFTGLRGNDRPVPTPAGDRIWRWKLETDEVVELELRGFPEGGDNRAWHGFDLVEGPNGVLSFYIINHKLSGDTIEKFTYEPDDNSRLLEHAATFPLPENGIGRNPNDVLAYSDPEGKDMFYVTSDHKYEAGIMRTLEDFTRRPWSHLAYYSAETGWKVVMSNLASANGLTGTKDASGGGRIYLAELFNGNLVILDRQPGGAGEVREVQRVPVNFLVDNPSLSSDGKDLYVAGHLTPLRTLKHIDSPESVSSGSGVARIALSQTGSSFFGGRDEYTSTPVVEEIFVDLEGRLINGSTTAVFWDKRSPMGESADDVEVDIEVTGDLFITGLTGRGILRCKEFVYDASEWPHEEEDGEP